MKWGILGGEMNRVMQSGDCIPEPIALGELFWLWGKRAADEKLPVIYSHRQGSY